MSSVHRLDNGLRVVHRHHPGGLAAVYLWFDAGTVYENDGERGAAHLLEHMVFKGSDRYGLGEGAATIEALGGDLNAYTTWDQTVLHASVVADGWKTALDVLADMAWNSTLDPEELQREKPVVIEEIRGYASDPESVVDDAMTEALYPGHAYGTPVLGSEASVTNMSRATLVSFWRRHYTAGRCILAVVGPMSESDVLSAASSLQPAPTVPLTEPSPPGPSKTGFSRVDGNFDTPVVSIGFRAPGDGHPDNPALEVLASTLGSGRAAVLPSKLRFDAELVADIWTSSYTRRSCGSFEIGFVPRPGLEGDALSAILELCAAPERIGAMAIERGRNNLLTDLVFGTESIENTAHDLAWFTGRDGSPAAKEAWRASIAAVSAEEVRAAARRWLINPIVKALGDTSINALPEAITPTRSKARIFRAAPEDQALDSGLIGSLYLCWPGGLQAETLATCQHTDAWAATLTTGAGALGNVAMARALDEVGGSIRAIAGRSSLGLQLTAPVSQMDRAVDLLADVMHRPRFEGSEWARIRDEAILELDTLDDRPEEVLGRRVWSLAWANHPWSVNRTRSHLRAIRPTDMEAFHQKWISNQLIVGVAGPITEQVEGWLARLSPGLNPTPTPFTSPTPGPQPTGHFESVAGGEQALVVAVTRIPSLHHPHTPALRVAVALLSAQSGPLFLELRERQSLAYSVWARMAEAPTQGLLSIGLATEPQRRHQAKRALLRAIEALRSDGPTEEQVRRTVSMLLGQLASANQSAAGRAIRLALAGYYGLPTGTNAARSELLAVDASAVRDALQALPPFFTVCVRPR